MITLQDIFNAAWQKFIVENALPAEENVADATFGILKRCRYLTSDGRKCAIGLVIPDGHPAQNFIGGFDELALDYPELWEDRITEGNLDLEDFQYRLHDKWTDNGEWNAPVEQRKMAYLELAEEYNLTVPV